MVFGDKSANCMESRIHLLGLFAHLNPQSYDFGDICALSSPFLVVACVPLVVCAARKLWPQATVGLRRRIHGQFVAAASPYLWPCTVVGRRSVGGPIAGRSTVLWPSYSRRRDRNNSVPLRSLDKGRGA